MNSIDLEQGTFSEKIESVGLEGRLKVEMRVRDGEDSRAIVT